MVDETTLKNELLKDYLIIGFTFSVLLSLVDYSHDGFVHAPGIVLLFFITGIKDSLKHLLVFIKTYPLFLCAVIVWEMYFHFIVTTSPISDRMPVAVFCIVFMGYRIASDVEILQTSLTKVGLVIGVTAVVGLFWFVTGNSGLAPYFKTAEAYYSTYYYRLSSVYLQPMPAATLFLVLVLVSFLLVKNKYAKVLGLFIGIGAIWFTNTRSAIIYVVVMLIAWIVISLCRGEITIEIVNGMIKANKMFILTTIIIIFAIGFLFWDSIVHSIGLVIFRMSHISLAGGELGYRLDAWHCILNQFPNGSITDIVLGRGVLQGYYMLASPSGIIKKHGSYAGPVENSFLSILYDFGLVGFVLYVGVLMHIIYILIKGRNEKKRKIGYVTLGMIVMSALFDMEYWLNNSFLLFSMIGMYIGVDDKSFGFSKSIG